MIKWPLSVGNYLFFMCYITVDIVGDHTVYGILVFH